jgi:hypothetical protein
MDLIHAKDLALEPQVCDPPHIRLRQLLRQPGLRHDAGSLLLSAPAQA